MTTLVAAYAGAKRPVSAMNPKKIINLSLIQPPCFIRFVYHGQYNNNPYQKCNNIYQFVKMVVTSFCAVFFIASAIP
jgi:hypothetical protein